MFVFIDFYWYNKHLKIYTLLVHITNYRDQIDKYM
jgi:hypothetical protein